MKKTMYEVVDGNSDRVFIGEREAAYAHVEQGKASAKFGTPAYWLTVKPVEVEVFLIKTDAQLKEMNLSFYTLSRLAEVLQCVDPRDCFEHRLSHHAFAKHGWRGELTLDKLGNFVSFA